MRDTRKPLVRKVGMWWVVYSPYDRTYLFESLRFPAAFAYAEQYAWTSEVPC